MSPGYRLPYKWVKMYVLILLGSAFLGNDFMEFSLFGLPFNPYRLVGLAAPFVLLFAPAAFWKTLWRRGHRWYAGFAVLLGLYALCSGLWVPDRAAWMRQGLFLVYGLLATWLVLGCADSRASVVRMLRVFVYCAVFVAVGATIEILSGHYGFNTLYAGDYLWARDKSFMRLPLPVFTMGNVNDLGAYLFFALGAVLWLMPADGGQVWRFGRWRLPANGLYAAAVCLFLFLMLCTQSRAVFLGLILAGMAGFGCWLSRRPPHWQVWFGLAVGLTVLLAVGFVLFWQYDAPADKVEHSDAVRLGVIRNAWLFFKPVWYRGLGWGSVDYYNIHYPVYTVGVVPHLHNWFLEILFSCGLFVFLVYACLYVRAWGRGVRVAVRGGTVAWRPAAVGVAVLSGFVAVSLASSSFVADQWFWVVWALVFGSAGLADRPDWRSGRGGRI